MSGEGKVTLYWKDRGFGKRKASPVDPNGERYDCRTYPHVTAVKEGTLVSGKPGTPPDGSEVVALIRSGMKDEVIKSKHVEKVKVNSGRVKHEEDTTIKFGIG